MDFGADRLYEDDEIGFFGIGMKAAMVFLSTSCSLKTKMEGDDHYSIMTWDIDNSLR